MTSKWKKRSVIIALWVAFIAIFSTATPFGASFLSLFTSLLIFPVSLLSYFILTDNEPDKTSETSEESDEIFALKEVIEDYEKIINTDAEVLREYENLFDAQLVKIPCVCGKNTFEALFIPNTDNLIKCESCSNEYNVTVSYNSTLLSEPLDESIVTDKLKEFNNNL